LQDCDGSLLKVGEKANCWHHSGRRDAATVRSFTAFKWIDVYKLGWNWRTTTRVC